MNNIIVSIVLVLSACVASHAKGEMLKRHSPLASEDIVRGRSAEHGFVRASTHDDSKSYRNNGSVDGNVDGRTGDPEAVLDSAECESFLVEYEGQMDALLAFSNEDLSKFICNPIEMGNILAEVKFVEEDVADQADPCMAAYEQLMLSSSAKLNHALEDEQSCENEMASELELVDNARRNLVEGQGRRKAFLCVFILAPIFIFFTWFIFAELFDIFSDERLKTDIHLVGSSPSGIPIYTFKYRDGMNLAGGASLDTESVYLGTMAQDLLELVPDAVKKNSDDGYYSVDYSKIDVDFLKIAN